MKADFTDRDELVESCADIASRLARRFTRGAGVDPDLRQVAMLGIVAAADRYDPAVGPFRPFATATALGELKKYLRSSGWVVGVPRRLQEATINISRATEVLEQKLGQSPTPAQLAEETGLSVEDVLLGLRANNGRFASAYDDKAIPTVDEFGAVDDVLDVRDAAAKLDTNTRVLLELRFVHELTQREIADRLGTSQPQVHRRLTTAIEKCHDLIGVRGVQAAM